MVRRETAKGQMSEGGMALRKPGGLGRRGPASPAKEVTTDPIDPKPAQRVKSSP